MIGLAAVMLSAIVSIAPETVVISPTASAPAQPAPPPYRYLPDEENWQAYCSTANNSGSLLDAFKCIPLGADPNDYLSLGADVRAKYEHFFNKGWEASNSGYLMERELIGIDLHVDRFRGFVQLEHATATNPHAPIDATWRDDFASTSAYAQYDIGGSIGATTAPIELRLGRQLLAYGSERMIDDRGGLNTLQSFDGIRARLHSGDWQTDAFYVRPVVVEPYGFDDRTNKEASFYGAYATRRSGANSLDLYGLVDRRAAQFYYRGVGPEVRKTLGIRYASSSKIFDSDTEIDKQYGSFRSAIIGAYAIETDLGYTFGSNRDRFRVGVGGGIASGDRDPKSSTLSLFRAPYPTGLTFGIIEANGNENTSGFTPNLTYTYDRKITIAVKDYFFYRQSIADGVYSAPGYPLRAPGRSSAAPLGNLGYVSVVDALDRHVSVYGAYARYSIGQFLEATPESQSSPPRSTAYYCLWFEIKM